MKKKSFKEIDNFIDNVASNFENDVTPHWYSMLPFYRDLVVPFIGLCFIDILDGPDIIRWTLFIIPVFFKIGKQVLIWYKFSKCFGFQSIKTPFMMLKLYSRRIHGFGSIPDSVFRFVSMACIFALIYFWIKLTFLLYFSFYLVILLITRIIRMARPPAVLLLAASDLHTDALQNLLVIAAKPFRAYSLLNHRYFKNHFQILSYRTRHENSWRPTVEILMTVCPLIVIDTSIVTESVQFEFDLVKERRFIHKARFITKTKPIDGVPEHQCVSVVECVNEIARLTGNTLHESHMQTARILQN